MTEYELNSFFEARARVSTNDAWTLMSITFKLKQHLTKSWLKTSDWRIHGNPQVA